MLYGQGWILLVRLPLQRKELNEGARFRGVERKAIGCLPASWTDASSFPEGSDWYRSVLSMLFLLQILQFGICFAIIFQRFALNSLVQSEGLSGLAINLCGGYHSLIKDLPDKH